MFRIFYSTQKIINEYNQSVKIGRDYFTDKLRSKGYIVNNGSGLSILIYFKSKTELNNISRRLKKK